MRGTTKRKRGGREEGLGGEMRKGCRGAGDERGIEILIEIG